MVRYPSIQAGNRRGPCFLASPLFLRSTWSTIIFCSTMFPDKVLQLDYSNQVQNQDTYSISRFFLLSSHTTCTCKTCKTVSSLSLSQASPCMSCSRPNRDRIALSLFHSLQSAACIFFPQSELFLGTSGHNHHKGRWLALSQMLQQWIFAL